jgi:hypothetical protein
MQRKAAGDLRKSVTDALVDAGLTYEAAREYWTPRRLALDIRGLTPRSKDVHEEIKGPSTKAPEQALAGFMRKAGLSDISEAHVHTDPKKGDFYVAHISKPGRDAEEIIADVMPASSAASPGPNPCAGARPRQSRGRSDGCGRCSRSSAPSVRRRKSRPSSVSRSMTWSPATPPRVTASTRPTASPCAASMTIPKSSSVPGSCSMPSAARRSLPPTPAISPSPPASNWSRTRGCSMKSPAWSNGRSC